MTQAAMARSKENDMVLCATEAAYLITKREYLGKLIVSIKGTVTALSELIRFGREQFFLIELNKCIFLVVKDFHLCWHTELVPGYVFVFHSVRLTTLTKGISKPWPVFLVLATSSFTQLTDENVVTPVSLQEWLKKKNITNIPGKVETVGCDVYNEKHQELVNYEGIVTSAEMASSGIFVLDNRIRLISILNNMNLKKDQRVFIYNAHIFKDGSQPYLICCMKSCIRIHEPVSSADEVEEPADNKVRTFIQKLIRKYGLNFREVAALLQLYSTLARKGRSRSFQDSIFSSFIKHSVCNDLVKSSIKTTDVFIFHDQLCAFNQSEPDGCRIPQVMDIYSLKRETLHIQSCIDSNNGFLAESGIQIQSSSHHLKLSFSNGKVLVGCIIASPKGTVFQDDSASLSVVILSESDVTCSNRQNDGRSFECPEPHRMMSGQDNHHEPHICCQCCIRQCQFGTRLRCPVLDSWLIGKTICVTRFHTVLENYHNTRTLDSKASDDKSCEEVCMYMAFSLLDCVLLDSVENNPSVRADSSPPSKSSLHNLSSGLPEQGKKKQGRKCDTESTCYVYVQEKQPLTYTGTQFTDLRTCHFRIVGSIIDRDFEIGKIMRCSKTCVSRNTSSDILNFEDVLQKEEKFSLADCNKHDLSKQTSKASFLDLPSKWYSCISNDYLYKFTSDSNRDPFKPKFSQVLLEKMVEKYIMRLTIEMPKDLLVERLPLTLSETCTGFEAVHIMHPVIQILSESFSETLVSFQGIIVSRDFAASFASYRDREGIQSQSMTRIKLEVKEIVPHSNEGTLSANGITVYLDAPRTVYTLGLVPGAVVKFHRVERKVSKIGNIYCRFTAISVAEVVRFHTCDFPSGNSQVGQSHNIVLADLPRELLINIWQKDSQREDQKFCIHCHIEKIFKLCIKLVCSSCRSMYLKQGCQSRECTSSALPVAVTNAVLLVEDGTCTATVKVWASDLVRLLLTLTSSQWEDLIGAVKEHGEILIDYKSPPTSLPIATFVHALIESSMVLRTCKMAVKRIKGSAFLNIDKMLLEDFQENEVRVGKHNLKTLSLPRMQLDCLAISEID